MQILSLFNPQKDSTKKKKSDVACPYVIKEYNKHMGGVDLADMLVSLYRIQMKSHRWCLSIFVQAIDICINNAWLLRNCDLRLMNITSQDMSLKQFRLQIYEALIMKDRIRGRPSSGTTPVRKMTKPVQDVYKRQRLFWIFH